MTGIAIDSRLVEPGDVFFAVVEGVDRYRFIDQVVARGAVAVVGERPSIEQDIPYVQVSDDRQAMAHVSAAFYGHPSRKLTMIGVTGTDGKTTTISFSLKKYRKFLIFGIPLCKIFAIIAGLATIGVLVL